MHLDGSCFESCFVVFELTVVYSLSGFVVVKTSMGLFDRD
jgi:hypothetical protein